MQPLNTMTAAPLQWIKSSWRKYDYELREGATLVATLSSNGWMNGATGATATGTYGFQRVGFWKPLIEVYDGASSAPIGTYAGHWSGNRGELTLADGSVWRHTRQGFWRPQTIWTDPTGQWALRTTTNWRSQMFIRLNPEVPTTPTTGLVLLIAEYLMAVAAEQSATVAATTAATSG
jgi:hypothetical protein